MKRPRYIIAASVAIVLCVFLFGNRAKVAVDNFRDLGEVPEGLTSGYAHQGAANKIVSDPTRFTLSSEEIKTAKDFRFVLGQGSGWHGFNVLKLNGEGEVEFTFGGEQSQQWSRANFKLSRDEMSALRNKVVELGLFDLSGMYSSGADDGTQWFLKLQVAGQRKTVWCDNHFPNPMVKLSEYVGRNVLPLHKPEIDKAEKIELKRDDWEPEDWREETK